MGVKTLKSEVLPVLNLKWGEKANKIGEKTNIEVAKYFSTS